MTHCVIEEKIYYRYFLFILKKKDSIIDGWDFLPSGYKDISHLSYRRRLSFLT